MNPLIPITIRNLPSSFTQEKLLDLFKPFDPIVSSGIIGTPPAGTLFKMTAANAQKAVDAWDEKVIEGSKISVSCPSVKVSLRNLPEVVDEAMLTELVLPFGSTCCIAKPPENGSSTLEMSPKEAFAFAENYDGKEIEGEKVEVIAQLPESISTQISINGLPNGFSKQELIHLFTAFGPLIDVAYTEGAQSASVTYGSEFDTVAAIMKLNQSKVKGSTLKLSLNRSIPNLAHLTIESFPEDFEEDDLIDLIEFYGPIDIQTFDKGSATFTMAPAAAELVLSRLNNTPIEGKPIKIFESS